MCESCKKIQLMIGDVIDVIMDMHVQNKLEPSPGSVTECLEVIFSRITEEVMMSFAQAMIGKIAEDLGLPKDATQQQIAEELVKQNNAGTLPKGLSVAVTKAQELVNRLNQSKDEDKCPEDMLN